MQVLADVCKIYVLRNFAKFTEKHHYEILYLMKLFQKRPWRSSFPMNSVKSLRTSFLKNSSRKLLLTPQAHKVDKNVSRYCNKDIKVISIHAIFVTLCQI